MTTVADLIAYMLTLPQDAEAWFFDDRGYAHPLSLFNYPGLRETTVSPLLCVPSGDVFVETVGADPETVGPAKKVVIV